MSDPVRFLHSLAHALASMTLYPEGHPSREHALDAPFEELEGLIEEAGNPTFTFLEDEVVYGREALRELRGWDWSRRLVAAGIQRLEFERRISRDEFARFMQELLGRMTPAAMDTAESRQMRGLGVRFGAVGLEGLPDTETAPVSVARMDLSLSEEAETLRWMQNQVRTGSSVPLLEAEAVVRSLTVAMHGGRHLVLPLLQLKEFDQYTTTHSLNVAVLAMGLAESLGCSQREVRAYGIAGLLHDIGKIRIPFEILTKPGKLTPEERELMNRHPVDGAQIILDSHENLDVAAVVAYEHHVMLNGGGYPRFHYRRDCALASRLVHVCDVYDALRTKRPYREAWSSEQTVAYLEERAGLEFDPDLIAAFLRMLRQGDLELTVLTEAPADTR